MKYSKSVNAWVTANNINPNTISLYNNDDTEFTYCDITGIQGSCASCSALDNNGELIEFVALDDVIGNALGRLAGAF